MLVVFGWVGLGPNFSTCSGVWFGLVWLGWVSQLMGWVGSSHTKWTRGQLYVVVSASSNGDVGLHGYGVRSDKGTTDGISHAHAVV